MKLFKKITIVLVIIFVLPFIIALFLEKDYKVERNITINKPKQEVFGYIKMLKNQDIYSVWAQMDPAMKKEYTGTDGTVGFESHWESSNEEVGTGTQKITKIIEGEKIETHISFKIPFEAEDDAYLITERIDENTTLVKWGFTGSFPYPFNIMQLFINMDKEVGGDLEKGLQNLKKTIE
ncbi:MAG: SRPBCC family protein [Bacteroidetes bacterium]|nr:polyketide cyclase [Bacteroidota bacterium]MBV6461163.1 hypothetical protein [Flavobacteriales bacterium]WKZ75427.1 MAG: SRPBCC family protein [Vicingaceae bacterium]MCL4815000.1 SRPBCC family protein [Flavobacteriales bacterium]NOG96131.1 SRPBCC family protein [Bacteroidota bacterium]